MTTNRDTFDISVVGETEITYSATDASGNNTTRSIAINAIPPIPPATFNISQRII
ncbi:hypothetical protein ACXGQW_06845 [Wenyingzhuangia sp. IMCC45533]